MVSSLRDVARLDDERRVRVVGAAADRAAMRGLHGRDDIHVRTAATDVAAHALADFFIRQLRRTASHVCGDRAGRAGVEFREQGRRRTDLPRRTVTALERILFDECALHWVQRAVARESFDRRDRFAFVHHGEREARVDAASIGEHRAGAALSAIAAFLRAREAGVFAQRVEQRHARLELQRVVASVDVERHGARRHRCACNGLRGGGRLCLRLRVRCGAHCGRGGGGLQEAAA